MKEWLKISGLLCVFGLLREIRPSEPYVTEYLVGKWRNITLEEIYRDVLPVGTYSYLAQLVLIFIITDFLRYKPLIIVSGISGIIVWCMLIWTTSLEALQAMEFFYGTYMASEVAYFTYIYAKVDKKYYAKVTSHTRAAMLIGKLIASISSQILVQFKWMDYKELNYITLATQIAATIWAIFLPNVKTSLYFHRQNKQTIENGSSQDIVESSSAIISEKSGPFELLWSHFRNAYTNPKVVQWSIWYAVALCGYLQIISYIQTLWKKIDEFPSVAWNGAVDAVLTFLGAGCALLAGYIHSGKVTPRQSLLILASLSILEGGAMLMATLPKNLYLAYVGYIIFGALYAFTITVASAEVAKYLEEESFGLVFGINTLVALILQTILTILVVNGDVIVLDIFGQYMVYSLYFIIIGIIYGLFVVVEYLWTRNSEKHEIL